LTDRGVLLAEGVQGKPSGARTVSPASKPRLCLRLFTGSDGQLHQCDKRFGHDLGANYRRDLEHYSEKDQVPEYSPRRGTWSSPCKVKSWTRVGSHP
jgi:hypothetical protein